MKTKHEILIIVFSTLAIILLIASLIVCSVFLSNSLAHFQKGTHDIYFKYVFGLGSGVGISIFLLLLISLNFASFLSNKKFNWKRIFALKKKIEVK